MYGFLVISLAVTCSSLALGFVPATAQERRNQDVGHPIDLRDPTDWDGFGPTFPSPVWPIKFFMAARWGRMFELTGGGRWCAPVLMEWPEPYPLAPRFSARHLQLVFTWRVYIWRGRARVFLQVAGLTSRLSCPGGQCDEECNKPVSVKSG